MAYITWHTLPIDAHQVILAYGKYIWLLSGIFVAGTCFAEVQLINIAVHKFLVNMCSTVRPVCRLK